MQKFWHEYTPGYPEYGVFDYNEYQIIHLPESLLIVCLDISLINKMYTEMDVIPIIFDYDYGIGYDGLWVICYMGRLDNEAWSM